jgi:hypothetical protein
MSIIYLDQNIWIALLRGLRSADMTATLLVERLRSLVDSGVATIPLSASHYLETWNRGSATSRHELAGLMREISGYATLAPVDVMERASVRSEIRRRCHRSNDWPSPGDELVGRGVNHAFGSPTGRFRFVHHVATDSLPEGPAAAVPPEFLDVATAGGDRWEWFNLAGPEDFLSSDGLDVRPEHRLGSADAQAETQLRERLRSDDDVRQRLPDLIITQEFIRILDFINDACAELGVDPYGLFLTEAETPKQAVRAFVDAVAITNVVYHLRLHRHRNFDFPLEQHDRSDMCALALAVPHCTVVATERRWSDALCRAGLDQRYGSVICASLDDLNRALDRTVG